MEKFIICFDNNNGRTFYFNSEKQTFISSEIADLSNQAFISSQNYCPLWIQDIAISEFKCSLEFAEYSINVRHIELFSL